MEELIEEYILSQKFMNENVNIIDLKYNIDGSECVAKFYDSEDNYHTINRFTFNIWDILVFVNNKIKS